MTFIRNFTDRAPPVRYDGIKFTEAWLYESEFQDSGWVLIERFDLRSGPGVSPIGLDSNTMKPLKRSFTTSNALIESNPWYRFIWTDENSAQYITEAFQFASLILSPIESLVRLEMPLTFDSLANNEGNGAIGIAGLRSRIEQVRFSLLPEAVANQSDESYRKALQSYIAKASALDIIPMGIEYWMRQNVSKTATGTNEVVSYTDTTNALRELARRLQIQVAQLQDNPDVIGVLTPKSESPAVSGADEGPLTPDPFIFPPAFSEGIANTSGGTAGGTG